MATYSPDKIGVKAPQGGFQTGGWYSGRMFYNGTLGEPGQFHPESDQAKQGLTATPQNPQDEAFIKSQINAENIQAPVQVPYTSGAEAGYVSGLSAELASAKANLDKMLASQKASVDSKLEAARAKETETLGKIEPLTKPFRENLESTQREALYINKNFEANQALVDELETLLNEGNALIKQQKEVTGLASIRNPTIQKTMDDVAARAGVIQAVINARNGQIAVAENLIDRSAAAISQDRQDQIDYYQTILQLSNRDIISLDSESKSLAEKQLVLKQAEVSNIQASVDKIKDLMIDPSTAALVGEAGIRLTDSIEVINQKMGKAVYAKEVMELNNSMAKNGYAAVLSPQSVPADQLITVTDSKGKKYYYKKPKATTGDSTNITASDYLSGKLKSGGTSTTGATQTTSTEKAPMFSPSYVGYVYTDPNTGSVWQFLADGWVKII
jgi:hypothetical protein